jgi:TolB-like protein
VAPKDTRPELAVLSVRGGQGFSSQELASFEEVLLSALEGTGRFRVVGRTDIATMLDLEAKKQAAGCEEDGCMTAIAGSLGADYVAAANVGQIGGSMVLTLKVIDARRATVLLHARQPVSSNAELIPATDLVASQVVAAVFGGPPPVPKTPGALAAAPTKRTGPPRVLVHVAETVDGGIAPAESEVERSLTAELVKAGFVVQDSKLLADAVGGKAALAGMSETDLLTNARPLAEVVVLGTATGSLSRKLAGSFAYYKARGTFRALATSDGHVLNSDELEVPGDRFGEGPEKAGAIALKALGTKVAPQVAAALKHALSL